MAGRKYQPPRGYVESHEFAEDFDALAPKYPSLAELVGALLWGIGENPLDFDIVPGPRQAGDQTRVAKSDPVILDENPTETIIVRIFFVAPEDDSGPIEIDFLDFEAVDPAETGS
jgi:hypothetical protein